MPIDSVGKCPRVERQLDGGLFEKTAVAMKPKPTPLGVGCYHEFDKELRFYINGKLDQIHKLEGEIPTSQQDHWFGNRLDGAWPYGGMLDEFVIYNRVLTEDEIQQDMQQVLSVSPLDKAATTWGLLKRVER